MTDDGFNTLRAALLQAELDWIRLIGEVRLPTEADCQAALERLFNMACGAATPMKRTGDHDG